MQLEQYKLQELNSEQSSKHEQKFAAIAPEIKNINDVLHG
jgi:hypothetical protein